jgi:hypothetical protein
MKVYPHANAPYIIADRGIAVLFTVTDNVSGASGAPETWTKCAVIS